ncbi:MAG: ABC transporter ATP-binding protein [Planctomycetota bacterium]|jgi:NitT/TauT family transport system ATP-binding protein/sulfonate transport system ATP-binding protein|nr:ABC transporter ATP-binding protein [Planctomycetota bacterium]
MSLEPRRPVEHVIECENIGKSFPAPGGGRREVVRGITLRARENEFLALFGPGQCGKTTLINLIAGLDSVTSGRVLVNGETVREPGPERGVVFQSTAIFPWLTTMGNVEYGPRMAGMGRAERRRKAQRYIDLVGLRGFENAFPVQLSGGMKQRVGIARVYCNEPRVMLMDEPFGALDAQTRYLMQEELRRVWEAEKRTVVFVTNNIEEAIYLADRIVVLSNCPATIKREYAIDLPRPRNYVSPEFLGLRKEITSIMDSTL